MTNAIRQISPLVFLPVAAVIFGLGWSACSGSSSRNVAWNPPRMPADRTERVAFFERIRAEETENGTVRYTLARYYASKDRKAEALGVLEELLSTPGWDYRLSPLDFPSLDGEPEFVRLVEAFNARAPNPEHGAVAFELDTVDIVPEGVAWDPKRQELLVGSMHQSFVLAADATGKTRRVIESGAGGVWGILGIEVEPARDRLWVASAALPLMKNYDAKAHAGASGVFAFDLETGAPLGRWETPKGGGQINDLVATSRGTVYATDSNHGTIVRIARDAPSGGKMEAIVPERTFAGPNGLVLAEGETALYVADYWGLHRLPLTPHAEPQFMGPPPSVATLSGIDGLERSGRTLIAIQNLFGPGRIWKLELNAEGTILQRARLLDAGHPRYRGPTTGAIAQGQFLYLADAALQLKGMTVMPAAPGARHTILRVPID